MCGTGTCGEFPVWMRRVLIAAGIYNLAWGLWVVLFPSMLFDWTGIAPPRYPAIWQCVGMVVGAYGFGYLIAAANPARHWPIVFVGLVGKTLGPAGFLFTATAGDLPWSWGWTIVTNDLIWWGPFAAILYHVARQRTDTSIESQELSLEQAMGELRSQRGATLGDLSVERPALVLFLRHSGCTFCRKALAELRHQRAEIEALGIRLAIVHMSQPMKATVQLQRYELQDVHRFSDPTCVLYRAFEVPRGSFRQLLGPCVWWRGALAALWEGHGLGALDGDGFRMSAMFLLREGRVVAEHRAATAADDVDFVSFIRSAVPTPGESSARCTSSAGSMAPV